MPLFKPAMRVPSPAEICLQLRLSHWPKRAQGRVVPPVTLLLLQFLKGRLRYRLLILLRQFPVQVV